MTYKSIYLTEEQNLDLISDVMSGKTNKELESKYGISSISYVKFKLGVREGRHVQADWDSLHDLYVVQDKTIKEISLMFGCSQCAVNKRLNAQGIQKRRKGPR